MARADLLNVLYSKEKSPLQFKFDTLVAPNMYNFISPYDVQQLYLIATSLRYSGNINAKYKMIDNILKPRGFKRFGTGTNRVVYRYLENTSFVLKIAVDKVGMQDNPAEYRNQYLLQPFVTKVFQVSPCGTVALVERVQPITSHVEFEAVAEDIYDLLVNCIIGKYVLEDIGTKYFMNYGFRNGFGPVLLDYTYVYKLDGAKLQCMTVDPKTFEFCGGEIDYDDGFNNLVCKKCGKIYLGKELEEYVESNLILVKGRGKMVRIKLTQGDKTIIDTDLGQKQSKTITRSNKPMAKLTAPGEKEGFNVNVGENAKITEHKEDHSETRGTLVPVDGNTVVNPDYYPGIENIKKLNLNEREILSDSAGINATNQINDINNAALYVNPNGERTISGQELARQMEEAMMNGGGELKMPEHTVDKHKIRSIDVDSAYCTSSTFIPENEEIERERGGFHKNERKKTNSKIDAY